MSDERRRIRFLIERDGAAARRVWVERTLHIYREAIDSPGESRIAAAVQATVRGCDRMLRAVAAQRSPTGL